MQYGEGPQGYDQEQAAQEGEAVGWGGGGGLAAAGGCAGGGQDVQGQAAELACGEQRAWEPGPGESAVV